MISWTLAVAIYGVVLVSLLVFGVAIGTAMGLVGILGITLIGGVRLWGTLGDIVWNTTNSFTLVAVPLFVLMGEIILRSGTSKHFYSGLARLMWSVRGGLAQSNIVGCAIFAAISGSSTATALTIGTVALPEMRRRGYSDDLTLGTLAGGGCLGILIPPSIPMIIYATVVQESVIDLFMAGVVPGLLLTLIFMTWVWVYVTARPAVVPERTIKPPAGGMGKALLDCMPIIVLLLAILGGMYFGIVTPTEAAAFGCLVALLIALGYRELTWRGIRIALRNAVVTNAVVMFIIINAQILSYAVTTSGIGRGMSTALVSLGLAPFAFFVCLYLLYLLLGMFIDGISMMLLTVPLLYPTLTAMGFNGVWFGVVLVVLIELGQLTPPMGLNLFAIHSIAAPSNLGRIARSSAPYAIAISLLCFILYFFPQIALWLPATMKQ
ncbi:MAG TPA: TRAP transporter large permease [Casimicrobiaceae bacterium]|nr:TRAP transporter large permease [Casimicrobiaceae bacterium]